MSTVPQQTAPAAGAQATEAPDLLDQVIVATRPQSDTDKAQAKEYFLQFLQSAVKPEHIVSTDVEKNVNYWIAEIDKKLSAQLNEVMHDPAFQKLEGSWRGLYHLVHKPEGDETMLQVRVFNIAKKDLFKDLEKAIQFDQSNLFKKVYEEEYGQLGGKPYGMLVADYEFSRTLDDVNMLKLLSGVASAAHAPLVSNASSKLFNLDSYADLTAPRDMAKIFQGVEYGAWRSFRESEDSRYIALTLPRVLGRLPYGEGLKKVEEFNFEETVDGRDHSKYLWMGAAWPYAALIASAFLEYGWMARTRGVEAGGKVEDLPVHTFATDDGDVAAKCPCEIAISDRREFELSNLGFLPIVHSKGNDFAVFMGAQSCNKPKKYFEDDANANAELSSKFNLMLCVSRFAHYLKVMARDRIGSFMEVHECEAWLNRWISYYVLPNPEDMGEAARAKQPLRDAKVVCRAVKGKPGYYEATAWLRPHFQLEALNTSMRLVAEVPGKGGK